MKKIIIVLFIVLFLAGCQPKGANMAIEFTANGDCIDFGAIPTLQNLSEITICANIYPHRYGHAGAKYAYIIRGSDEFSDPSSSPFFRIENDVYGGDSAALGFGWEFDGDDGLW